MKAKRKTDKERAFAQLAEAIAIFLSTEGWSCAVVSRPRVMRRPGLPDGDGNYEFVVNFTGLGPGAKSMSTDRSDTPTGRRRES